MSKYTIELRKIIETLYNREFVESWFKDYELSDYLTSEQIGVIKKAGVWSKDRLAKKIVDHYYMREIGLETPELFRHYAKVRMQEIMESKALLIYTASVDYDILSNVDYTETYTRKITSENSNEGTSKSNSSLTGSGLTINNDTPQTNITKQNLDTGAYASQVNQSDNTSTSTDSTTASNSGNANSTETYTHSMSGDNGVIITNARLIKEFRENIIAIDSDIIYELKNLFMGLY